MCMFGNHVVWASDVCELIVNKITHRKNFPGEREERNRLVIQSLEEHDSDLVDDAKWDALCGNEAILAVIDQVFIRMDPFISAWMIELVGRFATFEQIDEELMLFEKYR